MNAVGLFEAKTKLSEFCAQVAESGEALTITRRGQPWVQIVPYRGEASATQSVWESGDAWDRAHADNTPEQVTQPKPVIPNPEPDWFNPGLD